MPAENLVGRFVDGPAAGQIMDLAMPPGPQQATVIWRQTLTSPDAWFYKGTWDGSSEEIELKLKGKSWSEQT